MRLIRCQLPDGSTVSACLVGDDVHALAGDPLEDPREGSRLAALADVRLLAPCLPGKLVAMAINFTTMDNYDPGQSEPMVFVMPPSCVVAPGDEVINPWPELPWW